VDSPLKNESSSLDATGKSEFEHTLSRSLQVPSDIEFSESEVEDENTIHVDGPERRINRIYGGASGVESTEELGQETTHDEEYGAPILASDEVAKEPFDRDLQPAVSPMSEHKGRESGHFRTGSASSLSGSRPTSRPGSGLGNHLGLRMPEGTHLEDLEEYEPLFPEEEKAAEVAQKPLTAADRLKRPELKVSYSEISREGTANVYRNANSLVRTSGKILPTVYNILQRFQRLNSRIAMRRP
jgi:hypothetical protein